MNHSIPTPRKAVHRETPLSRRQFLERIGAGALGLNFGLIALTGLPRPASAKPPDVTSQPIGLLEKSRYVYVSPLLRDGKESRCHAEVWFAWLDDSVVVTVAKDRWKANALARGLTGARIWVGEYGRWKTTLGGRNDDFLHAPNFFATAERVHDGEMLERLLAVFAKKYPSEIAKWADKMRSGHADGSRIMIRYRPRSGENR